MVRVGLFGSLLSGLVFRVLELEMRTSFEDESRVHGSSDVDGSASHVERRCGAQGGGGRACRWLLCQDCFVPPVDGAGGGLKRGVDGGCAPCRVLLFDEGDHAGYVWRCHARP